MPERQTSPTGVDPDEVPDAAEPPTAGPAAPAPVTGAAAGEAPAAEADGTPAENGAPAARRPTARVVTGSRPPVGPSVPAAMAPPRVSAAGGSRPGSGAAATLSRPPSAPAEAPSTAAPEAAAGPAAPVTADGVDTTERMTPLRDGPTETIRTERPTVTIRPDDQAGAGPDGPTVRVPVERAPDGDTASAPPVAPPADPPAERPPAASAPSAPSTPEPVAEPSAEPPTPHPASPPGPPSDDTPTEVIRAARPDPAPAGSRPPRRGRRRALLLVGAAVALLAVLYGVDLATSAGTVPRGVTVAGQDIGGLTPAAAEQRLRTALEPRTTRPVDVAVGDVTSKLDPRAAGLAVDWAATVRRAGAQPLNPITRVASFFGRRDVGVVSTTDPAALDTALQQLAPVVNRPAAEGTVRFEGTRPVAVPPVAGQELDLAAAEQALARDWTGGAPVRLPTRVLQPATTADDVTKAVTDVATPAVSGPVTVTGEGVTGTIAPEVIAGALSFQPDPDRGLAPELNQDAIRDALDPQLATSEQPGRDAAISFAGGRPVVTPSQDGRGVDYDATLKDLVVVLGKAGDERRLAAVYTAQQAKLTTEELNGYGITEVMGEFTTGGFAADSGVNIKRAAEKINGTVVPPGGTFSLNQLTEPRDAAHGYVEAGVISDGHASRDVGGGVSQVATTTYNAAYFAGMTDVVHKPHSFYISRYPPGREATVVSGPLDLKWRNDTPGGVLVQTVWTPSTLTVRIWGTKRFAVTSTPGPRTNPTEPTEVTIPPGEPCKPSTGAPGFTITDTRTIRDLRTGAVRTEKRTTRYNPAPIVTCGT